MHTKLTLRLEKKLILRAKRYAKRTGKSVSQLVADYFALLEQSRENKPLEIAPTVRSLKGVLRNAEVDIEDYRKYLMEKHL